MKKKRLAILLSGRGSNFEAIARHCASGQLDAEIVVVVSNKPDAPGLATARQLGLPAVAVPSQGLSRAQHDQLVAELVKGYNPDLICLAGYMRLLTPQFIDLFAGRIVNIHPSLLPAFPGLDAQRQALDYGVKVSGCTVHFVIAEMDAGPIIAQAAVPVLPGDTVESLSRRILEQEHQIYSKAIQQILHET
jgi:phosphoribosylglycinamide formyltransferase 1